MKFESFNRFRKKISKEFKPFNGNGKKILVLAFWSSVALAGDKEQDKSHLYEQVSRPEIKYEKVIERDEQKAEKELDLYISNFYKLQ